MFGPGQTDNLKHRGAGCRELRNSASDYVEGSLPPQQAAHVRQHMDLCPGCGHFMEGFRQMVNTLRGMPQTPAPPRLKDRLRRQFRRQP